MNTEITFDERNKGQAIAYSGNASEVSDGCQVDLEHNGMKITAKVVKTNGQPWVGEVDHASDHSPIADDGVIG